MPSRIAAIFGAGLSLLATPAFGVTNTVPHAGNDFFESKVRPVLVESCYKCHSHQSEKVRGGLLLDTKEDLLKGGDSCPAGANRSPDHFSRDRSDLRDGADTGVNRLGRPRARQLTT